MSDLNDRIKAWLAGQGKTAAPGDYATGQPDGGPDQILRWNDDALGSRPTADELAAVILTAPVPAIIKPRQLRHALLQLGKLEAANAAVAGADMATQIDWEFGLEFHRADPRWNAMGAGIGMSPADIDAAFVLAASF